MIEYLLMALTIMGFITCALIIIEARSRKRLLNALYLYIDELEKQVGISNTLKKRRIAKGHIKDNEND